MRCYQNYWDTRTISGVRCLVRRFQEDRQEQLMQTLICYNTLHGFLIWSLNPSVRPPWSLDIKKANPSCRHDVIHKLQNNHALVILVADNLTRYVDSVRRKGGPGPSSKTLNLEELDPAEYYPDGRFNHNSQVQERLNFIRFLLRDGQLWLCSQQAKQIWHCLAERAVFPEDREACAKWFSKLMGEEPDLDPEINRDFFVNNILQLDPSLVTENGIKCFDRYSNSNKVNWGSWQLMTFLASNTSPLMGVEKQCDSV